MVEIRFDTGVVNYNLNGACEVSFNPTDAAFMERLVGAFSSLDAKQEKFSSTTGFEALIELDKDMRSIIDGAFGKPVCEELFGTMNVYSMAANGLPVWCSLVLAVVDVMKAAMEKAQLMLDPALEKYLAKYRK